MASPTENDNSMFNRLSKQGDGSDNRTPLNTSGDDLKTTLPEEHDLEEQLLMIELPEDRASSMVLRTVNELRSPGEINYRIPHRPYCGYALLQGMLTFLGCNNRPCSIMAVLQEYYFATIRMRKNTFK